MSATKVIVVNRRATTAKYGTAGWTKIRAALTALIAADRGRSLGTKVLAIDSSADAAKVGVAPIATNTAANAAAVKRFVDGVATRLTPDYIMLLGSADLLPQAELDNPLWNGNPDDDADPVVPSDLPYACDGPLVRDISAYRGPTRVVSRLPDLVGAADPAFLVGLLHTATHWKTLDAPRPLAVLALSTLTWRRSTTTSVSLIGGAAGPVHTCPTDGPSWTKAQLDAPLVFVNCHGGEFDPTWYGEKFAHQATLPHAIEAGRLTSVVRGGTVVAAECCYTTMHWNPAAAGGQAGVAATWLGQGAYAVFGASTTAYGPASGNGYADVIARMFIDTVVAGGSVGRAALTARQSFVQSASPLGPTDLKTLGQFELWGDPSIHPIAPVAAGPVAAAPASQSAGTLAAGIGPRRRALESIGRALDETVATTGSARSRAGISRDRMSAISGVDLRDARIQTFDVDTGPTAPISAQTYHIAFTGRAGRRSLVIVSTLPGERPEVSRLETK